MNCNELIALEHPTLYPAQTHSPPCCPTILQNVRSEVGGLTNIPELLLCQQYLITTSEGYVSYKDWFIGLGHERVYDGDYVNDCSRAQLALPICDSHHRCSLLGICKIPLGGKSLSWFDLKLQCGQQHFPQCSCSSSQMAKRKLSTVCCLVCDEVDLGIGFGIL